MKQDLSKLNAQELDELITEACELRERKLPEINRDRPINPSLGVTRPTWWCEPFEGGMLLQLRHPGYGWLNFTFSPMDRVSILSALLAQASIFAQNESHNLKLIEKKKK